MIRIRRVQTPPPLLAQAETNNLPYVRALKGASGPTVVVLQESRACTPGVKIQVYHAEKLVDGDEVKGYSCARTELHTMQFRKCCYCEWFPGGEKKREVEHFRPKSIYWWLAWSFANLLFVCDRCNPIKREYFPLRSNIALQPEELPPGLEECYLIDPSDPKAPDPLNHIEFKPVGRAGWRPFPRNGSEEGREMIVAVGLDRSDLLDLYEQHVKGMRDSIKRMKDAVNATTPDASFIRSEWEEIRLLWLSAAAEYTALSRDVLIHHFQDAMTKYGLDTSVVYPPPP